MSTDLVVVGAGGFGREALDVVQAVNASSKQVQFKIIGVLDSNPSEANLSLLRARDLRFLGGVDEWLTSGHEATYLIGVGNPAVRQRIDSSFREAGFTAVTVVHPSATVGSMARLEEGTVVCSGAQVSTNVSMGRGVHINPGAIIGHDAVLHGFVSVNPGAIVSGAVEIGQRSLIGAASVILQNLKIGSDAIVGAGACVVRDVPDGLTVKGVPAA